MRIHYPDQLPISRFREQIISTIQDRQVLIVAGDTGSGKTTQLPKMCLEAGLGRQGMIGCTQPRRLAAIAMAERLAEEMAAPDLVAWSVRFQDRCRESTRIRFMTEGILLAETRSDPLLSRYQVLILDEAHERSLNMDFLLGLLRQLLQKRPDLRLVVSSATMDTEKFSTFFDDAPVLSVSGRTYPIETRYLDDPPGEEDADPVDLADRTVHEICRRPGGDILVFMPTERDILELIDRLRASLDPDRHLVLPLYGRLPAAEQRKIFHLSKKRRIIVATNVAETSVTVPAVRFVVDSGLARIPVYNVRTGITSLRVRAISRASCDQRAGRCGRTGPGVCWRLFRDEDYRNRDPFTRPEIQRSNLAEVILRMISNGLGDPRRFPFPDPPSSRAIHDGFRKLRELGAIDHRDRITPDGRLMARLPLDPAMARILIEGGRRGGLRELLVICAALSIQDPRLRPPGQEEQARQTQKVFVDDRSDFLTLLNIWHAWEKESQGQFKAGSLKKFCRRYFLSWTRMREWFDIHHQLTRLLDRVPDLSLNRENASYAAIHQALLRGFLRRVGYRKGKNTYQVAGGGEVSLFPGSGLFNRSSAQWIVAAEFVETSRLYARIAALIDPAWLEELVPELCTFSHSDPHWVKKSGQVRATERVYLFGLPIVPGRSVNYGRINGQCQKKAREIFIRQALLTGEIHGRYPFLEHNLSLVRSIREMEERLRRRDLLVDEEVLVEFYRSRLKNVYDRRTLNRLLKKRKNDRFLHMDREALLMSRPGEEDLYRYPPSLRVNGLDLPLLYSFEPGREEDGVTVLLTPEQVHLLTPAPFEWLVPGLLPEKILHLLKRLPKAIRRQMVPLPQAVDRILDGLDQGRGSLYPALEQAIIREYQVTVHRNDWRTDTLPPYLLMRFVVQDPDGRTLMTSRSFHKLWDRFGQRAGQGREAGTIVHELPEKDISTLQDIDKIRRELTRLDSRGRQQVFFPALLAQQDRVRLRYLADPGRARQENRLGLAILSSARIKGSRKIIRHLCRDSLKKHSASWLSLGMKGGAKEVTAALEEFILTALFATPDGTIPDTRTQELHLREVERQGIGPAASAILDTIHAVLTVRRALSSEIARYRASLSPGQKEPPFLTEINAQLEELVPAHFLRSRTWPELEHGERSVRALQLRLERAIQDPGKDARKAARLSKAENRLRELREIDRFNAPCQERCLRFRQMVAEFRVSVFAPELGTSYPVSEKRLDRLWQEVIEHCRRVE